MEQADTAPITLKPIDISIVIPAFNEARRLPLFLERVIRYCHDSKKTNEIIVVDDGSTDKTLEMTLSYKNKFPRLYTIKVKENRGKGYAIQRGFLRASGDVCVFLDADGSVDPNEIDKNIHYLLKDGYDIFVGSRVLTDKEQILEVKWYRKLIGEVFNFFVHAFLFKNIHDTQCGFKMFKKEVLKPLFSRSYLRRFGIDIEILYLAYKMGYKVKEGPISWHHVAGSKVNLIIDSIKMFGNILQVKNWHCTPINPSGKYMGPDEYTYMYNLEDTHWWFVSRRNLALRLIKSFKKKSPKILDAGSGTGLNLLAFKKFGEVFGIDASKKAIEFCLKRGLSNVIQCPVENIQHKDKTFDIITCLDLLEHVPNPTDALMELKRVLKDGGRMIIMVPSFRILWSQHDEALCHLRRYERHSLLHDIEEAGLKIEKMSYFFFSSFFLVAPIRILRRFFISDEKIHSDTTTLPPKFLNQFLIALFNLEIKIMDTPGLPLGTTLYAIVSKKT